MTDHLNAPTAVTDQNKAVVWEGHRKPFGETEVTVAAIEQNIRFPGQYFDSETGLHYNYFRDYDPGTGRYLQSDPIGLEGGINTYAYVNGNPLYWFDLFGLDFRDVYNIRNDLMSRYPDLYVHKVRYDKLDNPDAMGQYFRSSDTIVLPPEQECAELSESEFIKLYTTLYHESRHANQSDYEYSYDYWYELLTGKTGPSHEKIYQSEFEMLSGKLGQDNTSIVDDIVKLKIEIDALRKGIF